MHPPDRSRTPVASDAGSADSLSAGDDLVGHVAGFLTPEYEVSAWVAERDGRVGHVALRDASVDPKLAAAQRARGLPAERLAVVSWRSTSPGLRRAGVGRTLLRHAETTAASRGQRAVLDVGQTLNAPVALYESEDWQRLGALELRLGPDVVPDLGVYLGPESAFDA